MDNKLIVISVSGFKGSGKDEVFKILHREFTQPNSGVVVGKFAFADPIKEFLYSTFNIGVEGYDQIKRTPELRLTDNHGDLITIADGRKIFRDIGMMMRSYDDQQFNREIVRRINDFASHEQNKIHIAVITDTRFDNEFQCLKDNFENVQYVRIIRDGYESDGHQSESDFTKADFDTIIINQQYGDFVHNVTTMGYLLVEDIRSNNGS